MLGLCTVGISMVATAKVGGTGTNLPYGSWPSPVTAKFITTSGVRLGSLALDEKDRLHWLEGRPQEKGRQAVVRYVGVAAEGASERGAIDITPPEVNTDSRGTAVGDGAARAAIRARGARRGHYHS